MARRICAEAISLIKSFEGLSLEAYPDPGSKDGLPFTIGYGHAGPDVYLGDAITEEEAEELLRQDLLRFEAGVEELIPGLCKHEFEALVSWAFNVGLGAVAESTLRRRILAGEPHHAVIAQELPRWNRGADGVMAGLVRRRIAEVDHSALSGSTCPHAAPIRTKMTPSTSQATKAASEASQVALVDFFRYFIGTEAQVSAVESLEKALQAKAPDLLLDIADWVIKYREKDVEEDATTPVVNNHLDVSYLYQFDSNSDQGARMCFSSSNAMLLEFLRPGILKGVQEDDAYLDTVLEFGDTTSADAQIQALKYYGVNAAFRTDGTSRLAKDLIRRNIPVPVGVLHRGHVSEPTGGGHWIVLVGFDDTEKCWYAHDPAGEMDVVNGSYVRSGPSDGRFVKYSYKNLNPRWMVAGEGDGWLIEARP
ncbi:hypothetical protein SynSYN20_01680 [Synechococcus sp. SYN20]|uniref:glycoside hydrolase family protein n=1 Tax=Synechococcus sp. SYN20 TaxID=1050714 RepID=UPI001648078B|nr:glycoside hydrolase family protein [Synechococcus sp. SYN20]QNJ26007.1 hypothetical protein SynSYN20_01680 [Synechococcus sp. SYN20]